MSISISSCGTSHRYVDISPSDLLKKLTHGSQPHYRPDVNINFMRSVNNAACCKKDSFHGMEKLGDNYESAMCFDSLRDASEAEANFFHGHPFDEGTVHNMKKCMEFPRIKRL